ncbi:hypothetical protein E2C01_029640 [Portunus trituberculatus]|uniref:Uncharacterized protein n=1 Tax=Portunus trituberculatus TaxID=210409 RepID=A0A5B7EPW3_PORTR|nr:hypothetical protein [Portunus trituberculatus]
MIPCLEHIPRKANTAVTRPSLSCQTTPHLQALVIAHGTTARQHLRCARPSNPLLFASGGGQR